MKKLSKYCYQTEKLNEGKEIIKMFIELGGDGNYLSGDAAIGSHYWMDDSNLVRCSTSNPLDDNNYKHALKRDEDTIIGYKLKNPAYKEAALKLCAKSVFWRTNQDIDLAISENISIPLLQEAGVLDLWFEPVYKKQHINELPIIQGYMGLINEKTCEVEYGCQKIPFSLIDQKMELIKDNGLEGNIVVNGYRVAIEEVVQVHSCLLERELLPK